MQDCIFCKIVKREIPAFKIYEDDKFLAFMDINPINDGQVVLIPKHHIECIFDIKEPLYSEMFRVVKKISEPLRKAMNAKKTTISIEGFEIDHAHIKIIPANRGGDLDRINIHKADLKDLEKQSQAIKQKLNSC